MKAETSKLKDIYIVCVSDFYYKNRIFDPNASAIGEDLFYPFYLLKQKLLERDITINTYDYYHKQADDYALLFFDLPEGKIKSLLKQHKHIKKYLVIQESKPIRSSSWNKGLHSNFEKIFTWNDDLVDGKKYIKYFWPNKIPEILNTDLEGKNKLCTMIAGNKVISNPLELYSERVKAVRWFEQNHIEEFDLYGVGWDKYCFSGVTSILNRIDILRKLLKQRYPSYAGAVKSKREILRKYKFSICYENMKGIPGYITEKIFDSFFAGCVPVYWGAPNVTEQIPSDTFVDRRNFTNYAELYKYLKNMPNERYQGYLTAINNFVEGDEIYPFSAQNFVNVLIREINEGACREGKY